MKADYLEQDGTKRIKLEDGTVFEAMPSESKRAFVSRVTSVTGELDLSEGESAPTKKAETKKEPTKQPAAKKEPAKKTAVKKATPKAEPAKAEAKPTVKKAVERAEANRKVAKDAAAPVPAAPKKESAPRLVNRKPSLRDALNSKQEGDAFVGKVVDMYPFRSETKITGTVRQVVIDKRVNRAYLRVYDSNGKLYHTDVANKRFTVNVEETEKALAAAKKQEEERFAFLRKREEEKEQRKAEQAAERMKAKEARRAENRKKYREMAEAHKKISAAARRVKVAENALVRLKIAHRKASTRADEWALEAKQLQDRIAVAEQGLVVLREQADQVVQTQVHETL